MIQSNEITTGIKDYYFPDSKAPEYSRCAEIIGIASYLPETVLSTEELIREKGYAISAEAVNRTLGTGKRAIANGAVSDTDLLVKAAKKCLKDANIPVEKLSKIIVNKFLGDKVLPMTATFLQHKLGCSSAVHSFDIDGGCNSFLQALEVAHSFINMGDTYILIVSGGIHTRLIDPNDVRGMCLLGDGATAVLLGPTDEKKLMGTYSFSNYGFADLHLGFSRVKKFKDFDMTKESNLEKACGLYESGNWNEAKDFIIEAMERTVFSLLEQAEISAYEVDLFLITENSKEIRQAIINALQIPREKSLSLLPEQGNTMSAMLPLLLEKATKTNKIEKGATCMMLSIGEGISGGGILFTY